MEKEAKWHENPHKLQSHDINLRIFGYRLESGDVIRLEDVYDSTSGRWEKAPIHGIPLGEGTAAIWVRPGK